MTPVVETLVAGVEALPEAQGHEVISALFRRAQTEAHDLPQDADVIAAADAVFQELDRREQAR